jgi:hypothetical protein
MQCRHKSTCCRHKSTCALPASRARPDGPDCPCAARLPLPPPETTGPAQDSDTHSAAPAHTGARQNAEKEFYTAGLGNRPVIDLQLRVDWGPSPALRDQDVTDISKKVFDIVYRHVCHVMDYRRRSGGTGHRTRRARMRRMPAPGRARMVWAACPACADASHAGAGSGRASMIFRIQILTDMYVVYIQNTKSGISMT